MSVESASEAADAVVIAGGVGAEVGLVFVVELG